MPHVGDHGPGGERPGEPGGRGENRDLMMIILIIMKMIMMMIIMIMRRTEGARRELRPKLISANTGAREENRKTVQGMLLY